MHPIPLGTMMRLASLTTMLTPRFVSVPSVRKWSLKDREMDMCKSSSFKLLRLAHKVADVECRYGSTDSIHTQGSSEYRNRVDLETVKDLHSSCVISFSSAHLVDCALMTDNIGFIIDGKARILSEMGYEFSLMNADIDEKSIRKDTPEELVMALAQEKADAIIARLQTTGQLEENAHATLLITADTVVVYKGMVREKPTSKEEARYFIKGYSGDNAAVVGSVLVTNLATGKRKGAWERAETKPFKSSQAQHARFLAKGIVYFHEIPDEIIDKLIEEGVTFKVAGGLMLEHPLTLPFVEAVVGSTDTVMGLSKALTEKLIAEML